MQWMKKKMAEKHDLSDSKAYKVDLTNILTNFINTLMDWTLMFCQSNFEIHEKQIHHHDEDVEIIQTHTVQTEF